jgi:methionyl-tRNA formyltransferase
MRIVLVTGDSLAHRYLANRLTDAVPLSAIVVDRGKPVPVSTRIRRVFRRYTPGEIAGRMVLKLFRIAWQDDRQRREQLSRVLGPVAGAGFTRPDLVHTVKGINTDDGVRTVSSLAPEILLIFGTSIVGAKVLGLARRIALNVHTGVSPHYRGAECTFWPLHNREPHMLGATVHECTRDIDGGRIFAIGRPRVEADDCMHAIYARCVTVAAELYIDVVTRMQAGDVTGAPQDLSIGREYRAHMHGLRAELTVRRLLKDGLIRRYAREQVPVAAGR